MNQASLAVALVLLASFARADDAARRTFFLESPAAADCAAVSSFAWRVLARTSLAAEAPAATANVRFRVTIGVDAEGAVGTLEVMKGGQRSVRHMRAASCEEVVEALALVAAVILDPNASTKPIAPPPVTSTPSSSTVKPAATQPQAPTAPAPPTATPAQTAPVVPPTAVAAEPIRDRAAEGRFRFGAGARLFAKQGVAPDLVAGGGGFVSLRYDAEGSAFSPLVLAGVLFANSGDVESRLDDGRLVGSAQFRWLAFELVGCPLRTPASGRIAVLPCVGIEAGELTAAGEAAQNSATKSAVWLATTAALKLEWRAIDVLAFDVSAGGFLTLTRDDFYFEAPPSAAVERTTVHEIPPLGVQASLGVTGMLP